MKYWIEINEFYEPTLNIFDLKSEMIGNCVETFDCENIKDAKKQIEIKFGLDLERVFIKDLKQLYNFNWCLPKYLRGRQKEDLTISDFIGSKMLRVYVDNPKKVCPKIYCFSIN